jgi:hypothetical protein
MDDFGAPATLPDVSRKRPRYDDQIAEYRDRASKKHAAVLSESLADAADAAASELAATPQGEIDTRLENRDAMEGDKAFRDDIAEEAYVDAVYKKNYPGPLRRVGKESLPARASARASRDSSLVQNHQNALDHWGYSHRQEQLSQSRANRE